MILKGLRGVEKQFLFGKITESELSNVGVCSTVNVAYSDATQPTVSQKKL